MLQKGDQVVYKCRGIFRVDAVGRLNFSFADRKKEYYTLHSLLDEKEVVYVPVSEEALVLRAPMMREEAEDMLREVGTMDVLWVSNEKLREQEYKKCISTYNAKDWIRILKTVYQRTKKRGSITSMDKKYQQIAERALYSELAAALEVPLEDVEKTLWKEK